MTTFGDIINIHKPRPDYKVIEEIADRWSPRHYSSKKISQDHLKTIFEAARWAPSGHNQQPWQYYVVRKGTNSYTKLFSTLEEYNQSWSKTAPILILACVITVDNHGKKNRFAYYDLGASVLSLVLQAQSLGHYSRQMGLFDKEKVKKYFKLDKDLDPFIIIALGKIGDYKKASKQVVEYELDSRPRRKNIFKEI